jgi:exodeoxyribonuclease V beta subunit
MQARRAGLDLAVDAITSGLVASLRTPLGPLFGGRRLADFSPTDRLSELTFDIPIAAGSSRTGAPCAAEIGAVLLQTLDSDDPMRSFASELARDFANVDIAGWLNGSIDAVLRVPFEHDHRYVVVDYKTNRLHPPGAGDVVQAYRSDSLVRAMTHHRYPLQALLYSVALHRYLRWRLGPKYSPDDHLGGIGYLFVRGMVGADTPVTDGVANGVFSWRPPTATIIALDDLFATGRPTS